MQVHFQSPRPAWSPLRRIIFRFIFIYLLLFLAPWSLLEFIPGGTFITEPIYKVADALVNWMNRSFWHVADVLVLPSGSGDTSYAWAGLYSNLVLSAIGAIIWSLLDRNRRQYDVLHYWLCIALRYWVAAAAAAYGIIKLLHLQMPFPTLSQLNTPLGDFLPMRLSWMFLGYSSTYQFFSGLAELIVALLLLWRRTAMLGALVGFGVFLNVVMLNLSYDIPVKLNSIHYMLFCLYLLWQERQRLLSFFLGGASPASGLFNVQYPKKWLRITRIVLKVLWVLVVFGAGGFQIWNDYKTSIAESKGSFPPIVPGVYDVETFALGKDTIPYSGTDTLRWKDVVFDATGAGSVGAVDTLFRQRYRRGYFSYRPDSVGRSMEIKKNVTDSLSLITLQILQADSNVLTLRGPFKNDTLYLRLRRMARHFQLTERQFHWLSETNR